MSIKELWTNLFDKSLEIYKNEDNNIRNISMIFHIFQLEFEKVTKYITKLKHDNEIQLKEIQTYKQNLKDEICTCKKNNRSPLKMIVENNSCAPTTASKDFYAANNDVTIELDDPNEDIFNDDISEMNRSLTKENDGSLFVDDSFSISELNKSPTLSKRKSRSSRIHAKNQNLNNSIIYGTPILRVNKVKKLKQSKLPMSFNSKENCSLKNLSIMNNTEIKETVDSEATFCFPVQKQVLKLREVEECNETNDINIILDQLSSKSPTKKKIKLNDSFDCLPIMQSSPEFVYKPEIIRKRKERLKLLGVDCLKCLQYYARLNIPEDEIAKDSSKCSRHGDHYNPVRLTPKGFWDPDFTPTQNSFAFDLQ